MWQILFRGNICSASQPPSESITALQLFLRMSRSAVRIANSRRRRSISILLGLRLCRIGPDLLTHLRSMFW